MINLESKYHLDVLDDKYFKIREEHIKLIGLSKEAIKSLLGHGFNGFYEKRWMYRREVQPYIWSKKYLYITFDENGIVTKVELSRKIKL